MCPTIPMCASRARSGLWRTIVWSGLPSHAWRTTGESVLPSRARTFRTWANSGSSTSRRLSSGASWSPSSVGSRTWAMRPSPEDRPVDMQLVDEGRVGVAERGFDVVPRRALAALARRPDEHDRTRSGSAVWLRPSSTRRDRRRRRRRRGTGQAVPSGAPRCAARSARRTRRRRRWNAAAVGCLGQPVGDRAHDFSHPSPSASAKRRRSCSFSVRSSRLDSRAAARR